MMSAKNLVENQCRPIIWGGLKHKKKIMLPLIQIPTINSNSQPIQKYIKSANGKNYNYVGQKQDRTTIC